MNSKKANSHKHSAAQSVPFLVLDVTRDRDFLGLMYALSSGSFQILAWSKVFLGRVMS